MDSERMKVYNTEIKKSFPTDVIDMHRDLHNRLFEIACVDKNAYAIPADIFWSKTVPLNYIEISLAHIDIPSDIIKYLKGLGVSNVLIDYMSRVRIRAKLFDNWKQNINSAVDCLNRDKCFNDIPLGVIMTNLSTDDQWFYMIIGIHNMNEVHIFDELGLGHVTIPGSGPKGVELNNPTVFINKSADEVIIDGLNSRRSIKLDGWSLVDDLYDALKIWYSTQICLLHPVVKEVFTKGKNKTIVQPQKPVKKGKKKKPTKIKYVKIHTLKSDDFDEFFNKPDNTTDRNYNRTALIWYVTGHWRTYKNTGKRVFIEGYWKGALRDTKKVEPRKRELVLSNNEDGD